MATMTLNNPRMEAIERRRRSRESSISGRDSIGRKITARAGTSAEKSPYDLQKERIQAEEAASRERQKRALQRKLATQGLTGGEAIKQHRLSDIESRKIEAARKGEIDIQEALSRERERSAQSERDFLTGERLGTQAFESAERKGIQAFQSGERKGTQQFQTGERIGSERAAMEKLLSSQKHATGERLGTERAAMEKLLSAQKHATGERLGTQQFQTGERLGEQQFQTGERIGSEQAALTKQGQEHKAQIVAQNKKIMFEREMLQMKDSLAKGFLKFENEMEKSNQLFSTKMDTAYNMGAAGGAMPRYFDKDQQQAFMAGKAGEDLNKFNAKKEAELDFRNAMIASMDPTNSHFKKDLYFLMEQWEGLEIPEELKKHWFANWLGTPGTVDTSGKKQTNTETGYMGEPIKEKPAITPPGQKGIPVGKVPAWHKDKK